jgi:hypothetical protein
MGGRPCAVSALASGAASTISNPVSVGFGAATVCVDQVRSSPKAAAGPGKSAMRRARSVMIAATRSPYTSATPVPGGACTANTQPSGCAAASLTANCSLRTRPPSDGQRPAGMRSGRHPSRTTSGSQRTSTRPTPRASPSTPERPGAGRLPDSPISRGSVPRDPPAEPWSADPPMSAESPDPPIPPDPPRCSGTAGNGTVGTPFFPVGPWRPVSFSRPAAARNPVPWYPATRSASIHSPPPMTAAQRLKTAWLTLRRVIRQTSRVTKFRTCGSSETGVGRMPGARTARSRWPAPLGRTRRSRCGHAYHGDRASPAGEMRNAR